MQLLCVYLRAIYIYIYVCIFSMYIYLNAKVREIIKCLIAGCNQNKTIRNVTHINSNNT